MATTESTSHATRTCSRKREVVKREIEAIVGGALLHTVGKAAESHALRKSRLVPKSVLLPKCAYKFYYHEREAEPIDGKLVPKADQPTLLIFHGISQRSEDFAPFVNSLKVPPHIRILVPEQSAHGRDIQRARLDAQNYEQPTQRSMLESTIEFLDAVECGPNTNAFGISLGGGVCYYVAHARPDIIKRSVLVSPAIVPCVSRDLVRSILEGTNNFFCYESREDVKLLMRDLSTGRDDKSRRKLDPVPTFFLETIYRYSQKIAPKGHNKAMLESLLTSAGYNESGEFDPDQNNYSKSSKEVDPFSASVDIDPQARRLVIWPEKDQIINFEQGKKFFGVKEEGDRRFTPSSPETEFVSIPDCGHVFDANGRGILDIIKPRVQDFVLDFE